MRIAAIDQGTTSTRILVVDDAGHGKVVHSARHGQHHPQPGFVEHDPEELIAHLRQCIAAAGSLDALGIDNQGESCLAWDKETGEALSPVIVWQDARTSDAIERLKMQGAEELTLERAGLPLDAYFSASKLRWLTDNNVKVKDALKRGRLRLGTTDAFFLQRLTGNCVTDITTASRTSLMNLATGAWDTELCRLFGVPIETLPEIVPTVSDFGAIDGVPVTAAVVDQQAALYGHGCRKAGDIKITFGTGAFVLAVTGGDIVRAPERGLLPTVAWQIGAERHYAVDGGVYNAGSAIEWAERVGLLHDLGELAAFAREPAIARGLAFVPALSGLAAPHWDRSAAGLFIGLGLETERADLLQAMLEGIALRTAEVVDAMAASLPLSPRISIDGGLTRSAYFRQFLADVVGRPLDLHQDDELTAYGTAALAARGVGLTLPLSTVAQEVTPRADVSKWRDRFADAVQRAKGWR
jgi:glycerol kinase